MKFNTKVIHSGVEPDPATGAVMTPIYQTTTFAQTRPGEHKGYEYSRTQNPTRAVLEKNFASLENAKYGLCFSSGMAAIDSVIKLLSPGDEVVASNDVYGGTYRIFRKVYEKFGIKAHFVDMHDLDKVSALINKNTKMIWVETPSNPLLKIIDIAAVAQLKKGKGMVLVVDNTFATPYLQEPIALGADIALHSVTKYLGGHSDVVMGALALNNDALAEELYFIQNSCGAIPGPMDSFLTLRGLKTLPLRMDRHSENAQTIAAFLNGHSSVDKVYYPGLPEHVNYDVAKRQMRKFGGMLSFTLKDLNIQQTIDRITKLHLFTLAESLGGVESLVGHPASMTHASIPPEERAKTGISDTLIRLSVGIEDKEDLMEDLSKML